MDSLAKARKTVEKRLRQHDAIRQEVEWYKLEGTGGPGNILHKINAKGISRPTEMQAIKEMDEVPCVEIKTGKKASETIRRPEAWLHIYRLVVQEFGELAIRRYNGELYIKTCLALHISRASYYANKDSMLNLAVCAACQLGLVKIIDTLPGIGGYTDKC